MSEIQHYGTGRRKTSTARVFLRPGDGKATVNGRDFEDYFPNDVLKMLVKAPFVVTETHEKCGVLASARDDRNGSSAV